LKKTRVGKAIRATVQNEVGAQICGINPTFLRSIVFILGAVMAGLAGILYGFTATVPVAIGPYFTTFALIVAIVGGVRSVLGSILAGIILGIVNSITSFFVGTYVARVIFLATAIVLILCYTGVVLAEKR